eukprot:7380270-Prymnesium_polylepis.1
MGAPVARIGLVKDVRDARRELQLRVDAGAASDLIASPFARVHVPLQSNGGRGRLVACRAIRDRADNGLRDDEHYEMSEMCACVWSRAETHTTPTRHLLDVGSRCPRSLDDHHVELGVLAYQGSRGYRTRIGVAYGLWPMMRPGAVSDATHRRSS